MAMCSVLALSPQVSVAADCGLTTPYACANTNQFVSRPGFFRSLVRFVGPGTSNYVYRNAGNANQVMGVLGGPRDDRKDIEAGRFLFTACRPHSCDEKGALIVDGRGKIEAASVLHTDCVTNHMPGCPFRQTLTIFVHQPLSMSNMAALKNWVHAVTYNEYPINSVHTPSLRIETIVVRGAR